MQKVDITIKHHIEYIGGNLARTRPTSGTVAGKNVGDGSLN